MGENVFGHFMNYIAFMSAVISNTEQQHQFILSCSYYIIFKKKGGGDLQKGKMQFFL